MNVTREYRVRKHLGFYRPQVREVLGGYADDWRPIGSRRFRFLRTAKRMCRDYEEEQLEHDVFPAKVWESNPT